MPTKASIKPIIRRISALTITEVADITEIERNSNLSRWSASDYQIEPERKDSIFLTAVIENKIVGFLIARVIHSSSDKLPNASEPAESDLLSFGVLSQYRKQGVGKELFENLLQELSSMDVRSIWLEVRKSNVNAVRLYLAGGFRFIQFRRNFYTNPIEDALIMKFEFSQKK